MSNNLYNLSNEEIYELLLSGRISSFPSGFWANRTETEAKDTAIELLYYLINVKMKLNKEEVEAIVCKTFLTKNKLHTASKFFGRSAIKYIINSFPETDYKPWKFRKDKVPQSYWTNEENRINAVRYLIDRDFKWSIEDVKEKLSWDLLEKNGLMTLHSYYTNLFELIISTYPNKKILPWEIKNSEVPNGTWSSKRNRIKAVKWLVKKSNLKIDRINRNTFGKYGLSRLLAEYYGDNPKRAIKEAYGNSVLIGRHKCENMLIYHQGVS
ncbi:DUF4046 domain-containing protein [Candidatus Clostridium stratigraminis]|uniref:DUF4046 domain-containing protein n=1 Tax=Candidatus Clostridium stratigraminis TaxID=3381661 RepID=A0ABW8T3I6_9CLOT